MEIQIYYNTELYSCQDCMQKKRHRLKGSEYAS